MICLKSVSNHRYDNVTARDYIKLWGDQLKFSKIILFTKLVDNDELDVSLGELLRKEFGDVDVVSYSDNRIRHFFPAGY